MTSGTSPLSQQSVEERLGRPGVSVFLKEDVHYRSAFIHGPLQPVFDPTDVHAP
ncbi:hypothetical protein HNQ08_002703 [Deinococcus humi]|uniref:Uncharacterized protein n=1 Tax=Deinococcus humi TaxID=662880 RepID=A0A7W8JUR8_9DEIO|nr:hypothetical protein [Deinococcus humi]